MDVTALQSMLTPELLPLAVALYFIGNFLKKYEHLEDRHIPIALGIISIIINALYIFSTSDISGFKELAGILVTIFIQGTLFASAPVYIHQMVHQETTKG